MVPSGKSIAAALSYGMVFYALALAQFRTCFAQDGGEAASDPVSNYHRQLRLIADSYELNVEDDEETMPVLLRQPIFSWSNPQRQSDGGAIFMWLRSGRPLATIGIWKMASPGNNGFEFQSLSEAPLEGTSRAFGRWRSDAAAVQYRSITKTRPPAGNERVRLRQMRALAEGRFSATLDPRVNGGEELRLLVTPLYRYEVKPGGVIDGAVFAFAQDTDPEVLLVLEARRDADAPEGSWFFAMAPATSHGIEAKFDDEVVLNLERTRSTRANGTYKLQFWRDATLDSLGKENNEGN